MDQHILHVNGAYGRRYATAQAALADWDAGKDFQLLQGPYCSPTDNFAESGYTHVRCVVARDGFTTLWQKGG